MRETLTIFHTFILEQKFHSVKPPVRGKIGGMNTQLPLSVYQRRSLFIWTLFCVIAGATFLAYALTSLANGYGEFVMPLDDVYIHFQYARQMAMGQPYIYNPGLPATSGATSFLYPYVLAIGYLAGFQGLNLGLWAMGIGALAFVAAMWLVYKLVRLLGVGDWLAVGVGVAFGVDGAVAWHFMSGMETGLVMLLTLGTLYSVIKTVTDEDESLVQLILWATGLALIRPEGSLLVVVAMGVVWWERRAKQGFASGKPLRRQIGLMIPVMAVGVQPLVNWLLTGSAVASGNAAKSIFGTVPFYWDEVIKRILSNFVQIWVEFGTGISPREGLYIMPLLLVLALVGIEVLLINRKLRSIGVMLVLWLIGGTAMLATLETVFWHFKRYQMPFMALLFPLAGWGIGVVASYKWQVGRKNADEPPSRQDQYGERREEIQIPIEPQRRRDNRGIVVSLILAVMMVLGAVTSVQFLRYYGLNVGYVYAQPLQMARWLQANTPDNAVIAVHDVGMMRYMGGRTTLDIVGLTTKGAADYWRNGPGSVAEFLMQEKPDYIASYGYGHGYGLGMIADTDIYGKPLASFPVELDNNANVALAANFQGIYKPDWSAKVNHGNSVMQATTLDYLSHLTKLHSSDAAQVSDQYSIDVANIKSENSGWIEYHWQDAYETDGFTTEVRQLTYVDCVSDCNMIIDSGRRITGEEIMTFPGLGFDSSIESDVILITRVHPQFAGTLDFYQDCFENPNQDWQYLTTKWIPEIPGRWLEIPLLFHVGGGCSTTIRVVPHVQNGAYFPFYHWVYEGEFHPETLLNAPISTFQNGAIQLGSAKLDYQPDKAKLNVNFEWYTDGSAKGDYKVFAHLYADKNQPPVAQLDMRPGNGTLPPGNWLPGVLRDTITVDLNGVPTGTYQVAIGMYDPITFERLQPTGGDEQGRLFIGEVKIKG